jgi:peptidoglycan/xylan/chitin deacetylase (PgdA/CDA1 family)
MTNFVFHGVGRAIRPLIETEKPFWIQTAAFLEILDFITGNLPDSRLTFDDGNVSDVSIVLPALLERGLTASFFIPAGRIGAEGFLSARNLVELHTEGMQVGSHGMRHRSWRRLDDAVLREEAFEAKDRIEQVLGSPVTSLAFPFGAYDRRGIRAAKACGFQRAYTCDPGPANPRAWLQPRTSIGVSDSPQTVKKMLERPDSVRLIVRGVKRVIKRWR